ncbi:MAG: bacterioferritin [Sphingomonadales bacterium]|nr:bacterioferritin [Sphingomonadales bacterium]
MAAAEQPFLSDVQTLRARARKHIEQGPITANYEGDQQTILKLLNNALATEIVCVLRYRRHYFMADGLLAEAVKKEFLVHAQEEQGHADQICERIVQLGGAPDLNPEGLASRSHAEYKEGADLTDMIQEDLIAERIAIESYREIINWIGTRDTTTRRLFESILAVEEEHADELRSMLEDVSAYSAARKP